MKLFNILTVCVVGLSGCSMLPYENDYSCRLKDNYGKCISVDKAYKEAVTGESQGKPMQPKSEKRYYHSHTGDSNVVINRESAYESYKDSSYRKLKGLINQPNMPMLKPAKTIRTLVVSYSPGEKKDTLYMPRYIYSVIQDSQWVLGQYLDKRPELIKSIVDTRKVSQ